MRPSRANSLRKASIASAGISIGGVPNEEDWPIRVEESCRRGDRMLRVVLIGLGVVALAAVVSLLGGSMVWWALGTADDLSIDGTAAAVAPVDPAATDGWPAYGGDAGGSRYSAAAQITRENVANLQVAWQYQTRTFDKAGRNIKETAFENTPILVGDSLIVCSPYNEIIAVDPGTGAE